MKVAGDDREIVEVKPTAQGFTSSLILYLSSLILALEGEKS
jgi:hypothetical protein